MSAGREWQFGTHRAVLEEPDIIRVTFEGPFVFEDARQVLEIYREVCGERPRYLLAEIGRSSMDSATRKYLAAEANPEWFLGVVYVGANLLLRIITNALTSLLFANHPGRYEVRFVADEAEARETIEAWRKERQAREKSD